MLAPIPETARAEILRRLAVLETEEGVRVLLAVESGSRAWGFASPDSDFDCRFVFVRPLEAYLSLFPLRDVIERPIVDDFDVNGWDLSKALRLMIGGNSVIQEWLASPIVYRKDDAFAAALAPISQAWRSSYADIHHYHGLLSTQFARHVGDRSSVKLKKYFYVIRPAIALQWLRERTDAPPMDLPSLLDGVRLPSETAESLERLRDAKRNASELGEGPRIQPLDDYIRVQAEWGRMNKGAAKVSDPELVARTEAFFRTVIAGGVE